MEAFFITYKSEIIGGAIVICLVVILHFLTNLLHKFLLKQERIKFPNEKATPFNIIKRILNTLWLVLGLISLAYILLPEEEHGILKEHFELVLYLGFVSVSTIVTATVASLWFKKSIKDKIENNYDPTSFKFLRYVAIFSIYAIGILLTLLAFPSLRGVAQTALGGAGVVAIIAGLAAQEALSNVIGGLFIITFKPFKIGDLVKVTDTMVGTVTDITLRHTVIRNFENKMIVIPNSIINKEKLINYNMGELKCCERIEIGISYDSDIDLAKKIMQEECENHPLILDNRTPFDKQEGKPIVKTALTQLNDSSMTIRAWAWGHNFNEIFQLKIDVLESIKKRFDKEGIEIPFPYRTLILKKNK